MMGVIAFLCGVGFGVCISAIAWLVALRPVGHALPPATTKQLARAARANRPELRVHPGDRRRWISPPNGDFDHEDTQ